MRRTTTGADKTRARQLINYCNSQASSPNDYAIIRALFMHTSPESVGGPITSLEQLANEACISQASVSRFIKRLGYASFDDLRNNFAREMEQVYLDRDSYHRRSYAASTRNTLFDNVHERAIANLQQTVSSIDRDELWKCVQLMDNARTVTIFGDDHALSDFYTFQLDLMARGVGAYLFKNEEIQHLHLRHLETGDVGLFLTVSIDFVREDHYAALHELHDKQGVTTIGFSQEQGNSSHLFDHFFCFGRSDSHNEGFYSLWYLSSLMSEMLYEL